MTEPTVRPRRINWHLVGWSLAALPLLAPLIAMRVTDEVNWTVFDFAFASIIIGSAGLALEIAVRQSRSGAYRAGAALAALTAVLLLWINGAVGIIGDEGEPANRLYPFVVALALGGSLIARLKPQGVSRAMTIAAAAQLAVPLAASLLWPGQSPALAQPEVIGLTVVFCGFWLGAAALARRSA